MYANEQTADAMRWDEHLNVREARIRAVEGVSVLHGRSCGACSWGTPSFPAQARCMSVRAVPHAECSALLSRMLAFAKGTSELFIF